MPTDEESGTDEKDRAGSDGETDAGAETGSEAATGAEAGGNRETGSDADAETGADRESDADAAVTGEAGTDADVEIGAQDESAGETAAASGPLSIREPPRILVPVAVLEGQTVPEPLVAFLSPAEVVVLGYHVIPEQTPAEQASMQFEARAREAVDDIAHAFTAAGRDVETRVAFTHDRDKTLDRVADEIGATAVLLSNPTGDISEVLVPLRGSVDVDRLADLVATLLDDGDAQVTLWALTAGNGAIEADRLLEQSERTLRERGLSGERIRTESSQVESPIRAIVDRSGEFDVIVMGQGEQTLLTTVLGDTSVRIAEGAVAPVLVVRRRETG